MFGRSVGDGGLGFGVDRDEQLSVSLAEVTMRRRSMVRRDGCGGAPLLHLGQCVVMQLLLLVVVVVVVVVVMVVVVVLGVEEGVGGGQHKEWVVVVAEEGGGSPPLSIFRQSPSHCPL